MARPTLRVLEGGEAGAGRNRLRGAYDWFRTEKQGDLVSPATLAYYDNQVLPFVAWLEERHPQVVAFEDLSADHLRLYRAFQQEREKR